MHEHLLSLQTELPEDIKSCVYAGNLNAAETMIARRLASNPPDMLKRRLEMQQVFCARLRGSYTLSRETLLREIRADIPAFTEGDLTELQKDGWLDFHYIDGEQRFFADTYASLLKSNAALAKRAGKERPARDELLSPVIEDMIRAGEARYRIRMRASLSVCDEAFAPGETYRVHLAMPAPAAQQSEIKLLDCTPRPEVIALASAPQRTIFFQEKLEKNAPFTAEYEYVQSVRYVDPLGEPWGVVYPDAAAPQRADTKPLPPHIAFTPYLTALAAEIRGDEVLPVRVARRFYDYITQNVRYAYVRPYLLIENGAEYAALNLRGDCGLQALLFITLCRISGISARWQSGLFAAPGREGSHDWAQFYVEPFGWLFCDCSFGGSAYRAGDTVRWNFYFGNLDPFRMVANSAYMHPYQPPKAFLPNDPYDNQRGECETETRALLPREVQTSVEVLEMTRL